VNAQKLVAAFDKQGDVTAWVHRTAFPPIATTFDESVDSASVRDLGQGVLDLPLAVLNVRAEVCGPTPAHVRTGWLRSVNNIFHAFGIGCFVDEIAHAKGADPRDVWLSLIGRPRAIFAPADLGVASLPNYGAPTREHPVDAGRLRQVIERVTDLSGWTEARRAGRALGLAAHRSFLSYVGVVVAVIKDERGRIAVDEAWIVADAGMVINAERVKAQMEGAVVFGMSLALYGEVTMKNGAVEQTNFRDYPIVRLPQAPRAIHVELVTGGGPSGGVGEPGVPPVAPAIANAVFALTGKRIRELPLSRAGLV
jgi:isoquinoline 1-oxidoreductase beta subunit